MGMLESQSGLADQLAGVGGRERTQATDELGEIEAVDQFHHEVVDPVFLASVESAYDVGMVQRSYGLHLPLESGHGRWGWCQPCLVPEDFDRHGPLEPGVDRLEDLPHAPLAQLPLKLVVPQPPQGGRASLNPLSL